MKDLIEIVGIIINLVFVYLIYRLTKKDLNPKLYVESGFEDTDEYSKDINSKLEDIDFNQPGFPEISHQNKRWYIRLINNGDLPATNVILDYSLLIKKTEFEFGIDKADVINDRFVNFTRLSETFNYDYIPPGGVIEETILYLTGDFPCADLVIDRLKSTERVFIGKDTLLKKYEHPEFQMLEDSHHLRQMLGVYKGEHK